MFECENVDECKIPGKVQNRELGIENIYLNIPKDVYEEIIFYEDINIFINKAIQERLHWLRLLTGGI